MAYQILGFATSPITQERTYSILCDTVSDLPSGTISGNGYTGNVTQGCSAKIIADGTSYIADSAGQWILQPSGQMWVNVYTKSEVDTLISGYQPLLTFGTESVKDSTDSLTSGAIWSSVWSQILGVNTTKNLSQDVPEGGYDADNLTEPGIYRVPSASVAGQVANLPQAAAGRLITMNLGLGNRYIQIWISAGARFFMRSYISTGWQAWFEYAGTQVVPAQASNLALTQDMDIPDVSI